MKKIKRKINFFNIPSLNPNAINAREINRLLTNQNLNAINAPIRKQARSISTSISLTAGLFTMLNNEVYGECGFILDVATSKKRLNEKIQKAFFAWEGECDKCGVFDFEDFEELILTALFRDGEAFIHLHDTLNGLRLEFIDCEEIDNDYNDERKNIICGIRLEANGKTPIEYYRKTKDDRQHQIIQAKDIIHIKKNLLASQVRGLSFLASSILDTHSKDKLKKSELDRARLSSEITGLLIAKDSGIEPSATPISDDIQAETQTVQIPQSVSVGQFHYIPEDVEAKFVEPHNPVNTELFFKSTDRDVARSLGLSYSTYTGDLKDVNYSSIRQGTISERRGFKRLQNFIKRKFHNAVFKRWLFLELLKGGIKASQYQEILEHFTFKSQGWEYIDPTKEVSANQMAIQAGFKTRTEILRERGVEVDTFLDDLSKDELIAQKLAQIEKILINQPQTNTNNNQRSDDEN